MILSAISLLDCGIFLLCLLPQLILQVGFLQSSMLLIRALPHILLVLPFNLFYERYYLPESARSPFCQGATFFQDLVIRCVRYAFAQIPAEVGRVFLCKQVSLPFFRWRLLRHGYARSPIHCEDVNKAGFKAVWLIKERAFRPDIVIYYCHGGGFTMGSSYFYLEFLLAWMSCLQDRGFCNPAILALEYSLAPEARWPSQLHEVQAGFFYLTQRFAKVKGLKFVASGDSAGATLILSMLLAKENKKPDTIILISPWTHLISELNRDTTSDYLNSHNLHKYAEQYAERSNDYTLVSPGTGKHDWAKVIADSDVHVVYGAEEVFAPGVQALVKDMTSVGVHVERHSKSDGIHAWPIVDLFLGSSLFERLKGLRILTAITSAPKDILEIPSD